MPIGVHSAMEHFRDARTQAFVVGLLDLIRRQPRDLLAFEDVRVCLNVRGQRALGIQIVALANIIGSEGRHRDFDRRFLPRSDRSAQRWSSIQRAMVEGKGLPAVDLYKISDVFFVRDGNHRISVARRLGYREIDASVTELVVDVPLSPDLSVRTLLIMQEYSDFLEWTNLHVLRPDEHIECSELGRYLDLVRHINLHRYVLAQAHNREISRDEAVASWYDTVYLPLVRVIGEQHVLRHTPGRTEADLYCWLVDRHLLAEDSSVTAKRSGDRRAASKVFAQAPWRDTVVIAVGEAVQNLRMLPETKVLCQDSGEYW
jgi:hypothetical protein